MTEPTLTAAAVAEFLSANPDFFEQNAEIFASLKVPHPHKAQAISLGERQILTLRSRLKNHEQQLQNLIFNASGNQKINSDLMQWCARMLAQDDKQLIPEIIESSLQEQFDLELVKLHTWNLSLLDSDQYQTTDELQNYAIGLEKPYCGPLKNQAITVGDEIKSIAAIPLLSFANKQTIGILVFGSVAEDRFTTDMGTEFLQLIARICGSALSRLL